MVRNPELRGVPAEAIVGKIKDLAGAKQGEWPPFVAVTDVQCNPLLTESAT